MKVAKACRQCRTAKRKCNRDISGSCTQCLRAGLACSSMIKPRRDIHLLPSNLDSREDNQENKSLQRFGLNDTVINELVDHYIDKIHDRPHSLFHLPTLRENVRNQSINEPLLLAICSLGSRLSKRPDIRSLEPQLTSKAKSLILADLENICLENIQTCILVANICGANGAPSSEALFFRIAFGMAQIMRLPSLDPKDTVVVSEIKRRVWWTIFMADRWYSAGLDLPRQIKETERSSDLPMDESTFHSLPVGQLTLDSPWRPGLWAHMITLVDLFGPIQDLNRHIVQEDLDDVEIDRCAHELSCRLDAWEDMLPVDTKLNADNLDQHKARGTGGPFVALHLGFHHYSTLLYFQYLESKGDATTTTSAFAERCKHHASAYSALLKFSRENDGFQAVYPTVGHMAIVSSSVLLYTLLFGDETQIPSARNSLNANFEALIELEKYWPALKSMSERLVVFQKTCLLAKQHTHKLNRWMIRFLIEHGLPIDEKISDLSSSTTSDELQIISAETQKLTDQGRFTSFPSVSYPRG